MEVQVLPTVPHTDRRRWLALTVLCAQTLMIVLDQTIVNVALPSIRDDLGFTPTGLAWVINAYLVAFGGLLLLTGRLGDLLGRRRVFLAGLAVFTVASLLCGLAPDAGVLVAARFVQGIGGAASSAVVLGMIVALFPGTRERAKAIGAFSFVQAAGGTIGSVTGGVLTAAVSWHWIFLINLPIGVVAGLAALRLLDRDTGTGLRGGADVLGAVLVTAALMLGVYAIVELAPAAGGVSVLLLAGFLVRQAKAARPLLPLRLFASRTLAGANVVQVLLIAACFAFQFLVVLYLRQVLGYAAQDTGLAMVPVAAAIAAVSIAVSARVTARFGERAVLLGGLVLMTGGLLLLARVPVDGRFATDLLPAMLLLGTGFGLAMPALIALGMRDARPEDTGLASGVFNTTQQVGGALGLSALAVVAAARTEALPGLSPGKALTAGYHLAFLVAAGLVAAAAVLAAFVFTPRRGGATR
ncbi:EmrB/QacA subfamily drug resistance transporter [Amycolatopsis bartoniae]|uniref:MFS transporter n=2 Tax=Amycolatopsis bartoniae TaxID=941986 RepID=UPI001822E8F2|nr:MFS transporter [Amycolatopsis bartoniae]MBB2938263.1 EmrB/QacA subfamily drug resistance transporter [Amycolatopsis bartoniae]